VPERHRATVDPHDPGAEGVPPDALAPRHGLDGRGHQHEDGDERGDEQRGEPRLIGAGGDDPQEPEQQHEVQRDQACAVEESRGQPERDARRDDVERDGLADDELVGGLVEGPDEAVVGEVPGRPSLRHGSIVSERHRRDHVGTAPARPCRDDAGATSTSASARTTARGGTAWTWTRTRRRTATSGTSSTA
jgi:hypothetical protein